MSLLKQGRKALERVPVIEAWFRRVVWSRLHFPEYELRLVAGLEGRPIDVAFDVGGALGSYAWLLNRKARRVVAFEPGTFHARFLRHAAPFSRIKVEQLAVGDAPGELSLFTPGDDLAARCSATLSTENPTVDTASAQATRVAVVTIDDYAARNLAETERLDLLKVDVEGFELAVFEGGRARIAADHPLIICEIEARHNRHYRQVFELLAGLGYTAYYASDGALTPMASFDLEPLQGADDLEYRLSEAYRPGTSNYINNFVFEHPSSRVKFSKGIPAR